MRRWARPRTADPPAPEGEPDSAAVQAGGPVDDEVRADEAGSTAPGTDQGDTAPGHGQQPPHEHSHLHGHLPGHHRAHPQGPPAVPPVVVPRWIQLVVLPLALLGLWALARAAGSVLIILVVAAVVALILTPTVRLLEGVLPRGLAILIVYLAGFAVIGGIGVLLASPVTTQITHFEQNVPSIVRHANRQLDNLQNFLNDHGLHVHIKQQGSSALDTLQKDVLKRSGDIVSFSRDLLSQLVTIGFDLVLILVLSIYLLVYGHQIGDLVRRIMPPGDGTPEDDYPLLVQGAVSGYVRGQLLFSLVMGGSAAICLEILGLVGIFPAGRDYAVFFGAFYGLMEFIPYIGPIIGPLPAILVALFNDPISAVWVTLLFIALQQLEGHFVAPQVFRISLRINPILIILSLLIGYQIYGIVGSLIALPIAAVVRETVIYLRSHLVLEPWGTTTLLSSPPSPVAPEVCPDCGARAGSDDVYCRSCGASLEPRVRTTTR
jgi:predicted PurR-regulated permease PerM